MPAWLSPNRRRATRPPLRAAAALAALVLGAAVLLAGAFPLPATGAGGPAAQRVTLTLLATTDLHGHLYPHDYLWNRPAERGLAKIGTLVRQVRAENPHTLLFDCGDTVQGTPLAYYFARVDTSPPNPTIALMNALGYDAMAVGNHEFNFGLEHLWRARREARFPWLAANLRQDYFPGSAEYIPGHIIREVAGVRVAIAGFVTPGVPRWDLPENYAGYEFRSIVEAAREIIPELRRQADVVVVIAHSGLGPDPAAGAADAGDEVPYENEMRALAAQVPGIDLIFFGHTHREVSELFLGTTLLTQARNWGQSLARADITLEKLGGRWVVTGKRAQTLTVAGVAPDPHLLALARPYHEATEEFLSARVGTLDRPLDGFTGRIEDHPLVDLIHRVQLEYGKADVSLATIFIPGVRLAPGPVTVRELYALYPYENTLMTLEMTGAQLKEVLEHAASFYPPWPPREGGPLALPNYQADTAEGVDYQLDLTRPAGQRIVNLRFRGRPLDPARRLRVVTHSYRYAGGGNYRMLSGLPVVYRSPRETRDLLIEYVRRRGALPAEASGNWEIVPAEARRALLQAARPQPAPARR